MKTTSEAGIASKTLQPGKKNNKKKKKKKAPGDIIEIYKVNGRSRGTGINCSLSLPMLAKKAVRQVESGPKTNKQKKTNAMGNKLLQLFARGEY